jgi:hypothetical protein
VIRTPLQLNAGCEPLRAKFGLQTLRFFPATVSKPVNQTGACTIVGGGSVLGENLCRKQLPSHAPDKLDLWDSQITAWLQRGSPARLARG